MQHADRIVFIERTNGPERLVCEAEIHFGAGGMLGGLKLVGFSLWRSAEGEVFVSLPARAFGQGGGRRYFDLLRSTNGESAPAKRLKGWILDEYSRNVEGLPHPADEDAATA